MNAIITFRKENYTSLIFAIHYYKNNLNNNTQLKIRKNYLIQILYIIHVVHSA